MPKRKEYTFEVTFSPPEETSEEIKKEKMKYAHQHLIDYLVHDVIVGNESEKTEQFNAKYFLKDKDGNKKLIRQTTKGEAKRPNQLRDTIQEVYTKVQQGIELTKEEEDIHGIICESLTRLLKRQSDKLN